MKAADPRRTVYYENASESERKSENARIRVADKRKETTQQQGSGPAKTTEAK